MQSDLSFLHPLVKEWFIQKWGTPTEPQQQGWPTIHQGKTTLISAPTGSGKTMAAFLICIDSLVKKALKHESMDNTEVLYVSPLKAFPYKTLTYSIYEEILTMLADGVTGSRGRYGAYLFRDKVNGKIKGRRGSRLTAITNGGTIPENGLFTVFALPDEAMVGTVDEES